MLARMYAYNLRKIVPIGLMAALAGCASAPEQINDVCAVFGQNAGFVNNWHSSAKDTETKYGPRPGANGDDSQGVGLSVECSSGAQIPT